MHILVRQLWHFFCAPHQIDKMMNLRFVRLLIPLRKRKTRWLQQKTLDTPHDDCGRFLVFRNNGTQVGFHRRYDPNFSKLKAVLESGKVGKLIKVRSISRDNPLHVSIEYLKVSGGIIADTASHDIDMIRYITGEDPETVYAVANAFSPEVATIGDHDQLDMVFKFPSGVIASIDISRNAAYGYDQRLEVLASKGSIVADHQKPTTVIVGGVEGFLLEPPCFSFPQRYQEAYKAEVHHFINLVQGTEKVPRLLHKDVHNMTVILKACQQSLKEGKPVNFTF